MHGKFSTEPRLWTEADPHAAGRSAAIRAGIARAKMEGTRSGRPFGRPRLSDEVLAAVRDSVLEGDSLYQTVRKTGVGMGTVTRIRKELRAEKSAAAEQQPRPCCPACGGGRRNPGGPRQPGRTDAAPVIGPHE